MFAFKATKKDMTCLDFQYELGKLYEINGKLKLCDNGFHFCKNLENINRYYGFHNKDHRYFLVEIPDDAEVIDDGEKSVTNKIKFIRELTEQDWIDHNMIREVTDKSLHIKTSYGYEEWYEYDEQGNTIHFKSSNGFEERYEYNEQGNIIHYKDPDGFERWCNEQGKVIHSKYPNGYEKWYEYDDQGNVIHSKDSDGYEQWTEYDDQGNVIHIKDSKGVEKSY